MRDGINVLSAWCSKGVQVVSVTQQIDLSGTVGHLIASVLFGIAEIERAFLEHPGAGLCTGRIEPLALETEAQRLFEANGGLFDGGNAPLRVPPKPGEAQRWRPRIAWSATICGIVMPDTIESRRE